jgi:phosphoglycerate dehydrogenase-like enzyme
VTERPEVERPRVVVLRTPDEPLPQRMAEAASVADVRSVTSQEELVDAIADADAAFVWPVDREWLRQVWPKAQRLRWIQSASDGVDWLLFDELVESDVVVTNARGVFDRAIAEYVVGLVLAMAKGLARTFQAQRSRAWDPRETESLVGRRLVVVGVGPIGRAIGGAARALRMEVRGVGRRARPGDDVFEAIAATDRLHDVLGWADVVVDALPATPATRHLFDSEAFSAMKPGARFINIGRGATVDEAALIEAVRDGRIGGAALDVFAREPLPADSPLWDQPNVIVSPHMSGDFGGWQETVVELFLDNLRRFASGRPLRNVVDKRQGYVVEPSS